LGQDRTSSHLHDLPMFFIHSRPNKNRHSGTEYPYLSKQRSQKDTLKHRQYQTQCSNAQPLTHWNEQYSNPVPSWGLANNVYQISSVFSLYPVFPAAVYDSMLPHFSFVNTRGKSVASAQESPIYSYCAQGCNDNRSPLYKLQIIISVIILYVTSALPVNNDGKI
jgi:hypothetical protein